MACGKDVDLAVLLNGGGNDLLDVILFRRIPDDSGTVDPFCGDTQQKSSASFFSLRPVIITFAP